MRPRRPTSLGQAVITDAKALANTSTRVRHRAGRAGAGRQGIASSVATINTLLKQFRTLNATVMTGTATGADVTDALDTRNGSSNRCRRRSASRTVAVPNGGMSIYTDSGVTLFQATPAP